MIEPRVLGHRALLKPLEANETTSAGVVLPDEVRQKESRGIVIAVGDPLPGEMSPPVETGNVVVYADEGTRHFDAPVRVRLDRDENGLSEDLVVVAYADILLVLDDVRVGAQR